jgi:hypothetical protein
MESPITVRTELLNLKHQEPFLPFVITMSSGETFEVVDPDLIAVGDFAVIHIKPRQPGHSVLPLQQVASLQVIELR